MQLPLTTMLFLALTASGPRAVALHPLVAHGATPEAMQQLDAAIRIELARVGTVKQASVAQAGPREAECAASRACLLAFGRRMGAAEVLYGEVRALPDSFAVTLRLLDVASGRELEAATASVNRDVEEMVWATRAQVRRLKAPAQYAGRLALALPRDARPRLAGREIEPDAAVVLEPGTYGLALTHAGRETESWIEVRFEQSATVSLLASGALDVRYEPWTAIPEGKLDLVPPRPDSAGAPAGDGLSQSESRWPGYALLGLGAALMVCGTVQMVRAAHTRDELAAMGTTVGIRPEEHRDYLDKKAELSRTRTSGWLLLGGGAAAALGGGALLLFAPAPAPSLQVIGTF